MYLPTPKAHHVESGGRKATGLQRANAKIAGLPITVNPFYLCHSTCADFDAIKARTDFPFVASHMLLAEMSMKAYWADQNSGDEIGWTSVNGNSVNGNSVNGNSSQLELKSTGTQSTGTQSTGTQSTRTQANSNSSQLEFGQLKQRQLGQRQLGRLTVQQTIVRASGGICSLHEFYGLIVSKIQSLGEDTENEPTPYLPS